MSNKEHRAFASLTNTERKFGKSGTLALVGLWFICLGGMVGPTQGQQERSGRKYSDNIEAYRAFLQGWELSGHPTQAANVQARQMFERATERDPKYAAAYAMMGWTHLLEWLWQWTQDHQALERAFTLEQKAVALDDSLPLAHMFLGTAYLFKSQHEQAIVEAEKAIAIGSNSADGYAALAQILTYVGKSEEGIKLVEKAMHLNPHYQPTYLSILGQAYYAARRYEEAIVTLKQLLNRNPDHLAGHVYLAVIYGESERKEEARIEIAEVLRISPQFSVEGVRQRLPYKDQTEAAHFLDSLRMAGLK